MTTINEHQSVVIQHLLKEVADLHDRVTVLEAGFFNLAADKLPEVIQIRDIGREQAKAEIAELFEQNTEETLYYSDIQDRLGLDLEMIVEICQELLDEEVIRINANHTV